MNKYKYIYDLDRLPSDIDMAKLIRTARHWKSNHDDTCRKKKNISKKYGALVRKLIKLINSTTKRGGDDAKL